MILDTNALSALARMEGALIRQLDSAKKVAVTIISIGEYEFGIRQSRHRAELDAWLAAFLDGAEILFVNLDTISHYAELRVELKQAGTPIPANDCWIAALARQYRMPLLSRDQHFDLVHDLLRIDW